MLANLDKQTADHQDFSKKNLEDKLLSLQCRHRFIGQTGWRYFIQPSI